MRILLALGFFLMAGGLIAQNGGESSGLKVDEVLPGPFDAFVINGKINGKKIEGRQHCLVCEYGFNPVVLVFAREPAEGKDGPLTLLLAKLDEVSSRHMDDLLKSCVIFLSPDGQSSATKSGEQDPKKIMEEELARAALVKRLGARADKLKNVTVAYFPAEGPKEYRVNAKAEVTVLFYQRHKVLANFTFSEGKMAAKDVDNIIKSVDDTLNKKR